ncbi:MAG: quinol:electron acceptor oxidoreductase subunit ActD, partial [Opitutales bacterium]
YELTILLAAFGTFFGMFITNRLPRHNHPVFEFKRFAATSDDKFAIVIEAGDPNYDEKDTHALLKELGGKHVTAVKEEEE